MRRLIQDTFAEPDDQGALRSEPLIIHLRAEPTRNRALIIFVHGLGGSRYGLKATWGFLPRFVFEDFPDFDIGLYEYVTLFRRLKFWNSIHLSKEAIVFADLIRDVTPYEVVVLVGHSMGGLLCQAAIGKLVNAAEDQALRKIGGLILMASPQTGSQRVPSILSFFSKDAYALRPHGDFVTSLQWILTNRVWLYEAGNPPPKRYPIPAWAILGSSDFWVDRLSASVSLPDSQTKTIRGSHTEIVKPSSKQHDGYNFLCECIRKIVAKGLATNENQRLAEERNLAVRIPASRLPAVGIFFDRTETLASLVEFLNDQTRKLVVIAGLPGIGKTALAAKAASDSALHFKDVFWMTCSPERASVDMLLGQLHSFLERQGDESLRGLWNASSPSLLPAKIDALVEALSRNTYLLVFDVFASWLDEQLQVKNPDLWLILHGLISSAHRSKIILISERRPFFDPQSSPIPPGVIQNEELFGLGEADGFNLLKQYLPGENENLLRTIVQTCGANPRMLNMFGSLVREGRREAQSLLAPEGVELFSKLLSGTTEDLTRESREALERLAICRWPLTKQDLDHLQISFQKAVVPLLDRFLATWHPYDNSVSLAESAKAFVRARLPLATRERLHLEAVDFYGAKQSITQASTFRDVLPVLEKAYHLSELGRWLESADTLLGVSTMLTEWGYLDIVRDEVNRVLEAIKADPLCRARCLWTLADIHDIRGEYPQAVDMFDRALQAFDSVPNYEGVAKCRWRVGRIRNALGDFSGALDDFRACIHICDQRTVVVPKAAALLDQSWTLAQQGDPESAMVLMKLSLDLATKSNDFETQIGASRQIGWYLWDYKREDQEAGEFYQRSLEIGTKHGLLKELGAVHADLGYLRTQWGDPHGAEESCRTAIKIREALGDQYGLASAYLNLGLVFQTRKAYPEENRCYNESLLIYRRLNVPGGEAEVLLRQGVVWREQARFDESEKTLRQALEIIQKHGLKLTLAAIFYEMGRTLVIAGRNQEGRIWLERAVEEAGKIKSPRTTEYEQYLRTVLA